MAFPLLDENWARTGSTSAVGALGNQRPYCDLVGSFVEGLQKEPFSFPLPSSSMAVAFAMAGLALLSRLYPSLSGLLFRFHPNPVQEVEKVTYLFIYGHPESQAQMPWQGLFVHG